MSRLRECPIGEGFMDQRAFLRRFQECCPGGYVLIEHMPDDRVLPAKQALDAALAAAGLRWEE